MFSPYSFSESSGIFESMADIQNALSYTQTIYQDFYAARNEITYCMLIALGVRQLRHKFWTISRAFLGVLSSPRASSDIPYCVPMLIAFAACWLARAIRCCARFTAAHA